MSAMICNRGVKLIMMSYGFSHMDSNVFYDIDVMISLITTIIYQCIWSIKSYDVGIAA